jgi:hypothetical protein
MDKHLFIVNGQDGPAIHRVQKLVVVEPRHARVSVPAERLRLAGKEGTE